MSEGTRWLIFVGDSGATWKAIAVAVKAVAIVDATHTAWMPLTDFEDGTLRVAWNSPTDYLEVVIGRNGSCEWFWRSTERDITEDGDVLDERFARAVCEMRRMPIGVAA